MDLSKVSKRDLLFYLSKYSDELPSGWKYEHIRELQKFAKRIFEERLIDQGTRKLICQNTLEESSIQTDAMVDHLISMVYRNNINRSPHLSLEKNSSNER